MRISKVEKKIDIEKMWIAACSGDIEMLKQYPQFVNERYNKFGKKHSLLMGAFRNGQWEMIDYLISIGGTLQCTERVEIETELIRIDYMKKLVEIK